MEADTAPSTTPAALAQNRLKASATLLLAR